MVDLEIPYVESDELCKFNELTAALDAAQIPYQTEEQDDQMIVSVEDEHENDLVDAAEAVGIYTDPYGDDAEDALGAGESGYRTEGIIDDVMNGKDPHEALAEIFQVMAHKKKKKK